MAFMMKQSSVALVFVVLSSLVALNLVTGKEGDANTISAAAKLDAEASLQSGAQKSSGKGMPVLLVRESKDKPKPDIWLGFLNYQGMSQVQPMVAPFVQPIQPFTQQMTQTIFDSVPMAQSIYEQAYQLGDQVSGIFNPASFLGNLSGGGSGSGSAGGNAGSTSASGSSSGGSSSGGSSSGGQSGLSAMIPGLSRVRS